MEDQLQWLGAGEILPQERRSSTDTHPQLGWQSDVQIQHAIHARHLLAGSVRA